MDIDAYSLQCFHPGDSAARDDVPAGRGAALRESVAVDEVAHIGAGVSHLQTLDMRFNEEHPPLAKVLASLPLVARGTHADYSGTIWNASREFFPAYLGEWIFGEYVLTHWNNPLSTLAWARFPMLLLTIALGWLVFALARRLGGDWGGLLCVAVYASTPVFLVFGPLVLTDIPITFFSLLACWALAGLWDRPDRKSTLLLALALAGALLTKFTAPILFIVFAAVALSTRWRPLSAQPVAKPDARLWRRLAGVPCGKPPGGPRRWCTRSTSSSPGTSRSTSLALPVMVHWPHCWDVC
jgi:dolichyl-phosphate-mannose--protein O-mannosyl transferase